MKNLYVYDMPTPIRDALQHYKIDEGISLRELIMRIVTPELVAKGYLKSSETEAKHESNY